MKTLTDVLTGRQHFKIHLFSSYPQITISSQILTICTRCDILSLTLCWRDDTLTFVPSSPSDHRSSREEVLGLDRWLHPGLPLHIPADVDQQAGVRRVRPQHRPPQVLLEEERKDGGERKAARCRSSTRKQLWQIFEWTKSCETPHARERQWLF